MASVREIAKRAGVSATTVSRALSNHPNVSLATRQRVVREANRSGYAPAPGDRTGCCIGFATTTASVLSPYDTLLLNGMTRGLHESRFDVQLVNLERDRAPGETYTQFFNRRGLRGVILQTYTEYRGVCEAIAAEGFPSVVVAERFDDPAVNFVSCDSTGQSRAAVQHLIDLGHRRIALAVAHRLDRDHQDRLEGYRQALAAGGIDWDEQLVLRIDPTAEAGASVINQLLSMREPPTGVFFTDPYTTVGALCRAAAVGLRVPEQLSVVGVDDGNIRRRVHPVMTAVCQPTSELGRIAALWLGRRISGEPCEQPLHRVLDATLEINQSTGAPPATPARRQPDGRPLSA